MDNPKQEGEEDIPLATEDVEGTYEPEEFGEDAGVSSPLNAIN
jgi:hypothetical protein